MKTKLHNIYRIDMPERSMAGWQVRTKVDGKDRSKYFGDKKYYNDVVVSLQEAIRYRDTVIDFINR